MTLSIILTVYNKASFLPKAFESLLRQLETDGDEYEVVVVNDGSTDDSLVVIEHYASNYSRIRVVSQNNLGLSMARNNGTKAANGDYVWYVDADDVISPYSVRYICDATASRPDVIPIYAKTEGEEIIRNYVPKSAQTGREVLLSGKWLACGVFNVFRRSFLLNNNLNFFPGIYHEDSEFTPRVLYLAKKVVVVPEVLYTVIHEPNSITQVPRPKRAFDCLIVAERLKSFIESQMITDPAVLRIFYNYISSVINGALKVIVQNSAEDQVRFNKILHSKPSLLQIFFKTGVTRYIIEGYLFKLFPERYTLIYSLMKKLYQR